MVLQPLLAFTIFKFPQMIVELAMLAILLVGVVSSKLLIDEIALLILYLFSQCLSFMFNDSYEFLVGAKQFGLGILSIIYFRRNEIKFGQYVLFGIFFINILITLLQYFDVSALKMSYRLILGVFADFEETKHIGLFLNYHFSSFYSAIYLIYITRTRFLFLTEYIYFLKAGTGTSLVSYIMHGIYMYAIKNKLIQELSLGRLILLFVVTVIIGVLLVNSYIILIDYSADKIGETGESALVVISQLSDISFYMSFFSFIPIDPTNYVVVNSYDHFTLGHHGGNEVQYLSTVLQAGLPLGVYYFYIVLKRYPLYRVFLLYAMLHYCFILMPLVIYIYSLGSRNQEVEKKA
jgi:hypothetical protein